MSRENFRFVHRQFLDNEGQNLATRLARFLPQAGVTTTLSTWVGRVSVLPIDRKWLDSGNVIAPIHHNSAPELDDHLAVLVETRRFEPHDPHVRARARLAFL